LPVRGCTRALGESARLEEGSDGLLLEEGPSVLPSPPSGGETAV
jgi:hypothetical protein